METRPSARSLFKKFDSGNKFSFPVQYYCISLVCSKYFVRDCSLKIFIAKVVSIPTMPTFSKVMDRHRLGWVSAGGAYESNYSGGDGLAQVVGDKAQRWEA